MKVAQVFPFYGVNGLDRYIAALNRYLKKIDGVTVHNFAVVQKEQLSSFRQVDYFDETTTTVVFGSFAPQSRVNLMSDCYLPAIEKEFKAFLNNAKPDVVNFQHLSDLGASLIGIAKDMGIQTVVTFHDYWAICPRNFLVNYWLETCQGPNFGSNCYSCFHPDDDAFSKANDRGQFILRYSFIKEILMGKTDLILTVSNSMRDRFIDEGIPSNKIKIIYPSVSPANIAANRTITEKRMNIGFVGHWTPIKGPHILIEAFKRLNRSDANLYLYGTEEPLFRSTLLRLAGNSENIHFMGAYKPSEAVDVYANLDLLVVPSICPEQPLVILEAFQYGIPVIGSRLGGIPEYVSDQSGLLFEPGNVNDLKDKLQIVLEHPELLSSWRENIPAWQTVQEMSQKVHDEYRTLFERKSQVRTVSHEHTKLLEPHNKGFLRKQVFPVQIQKLIRELEQRNINRIGIFPAMVDAPTIVKKLAKHNIETVCFIDNNPNRRNTHFENIPVLLAEEINEKELKQVDLIVVASSHEATIINQLETMGWKVPYIGFYSS